MAIRPYRSYHQFNVEIGERIRVARQSAGVSLAELAKAIAKSGVTMHEIETGKVYIKAAHVAMIALALNCTVRSLYPKGSVR